jgi:hypothetical protein
VRLSDYLASDEWTPMALVADAVTLVVLPAFFVTWLVARVVAWLRGEP